jgi:putative membrane protein
MTDDALTFRTRPLPVALALAAVVLQLAYPLLGGSGRQRLAVAIVVMFAAASVTHVYVTRGSRLALAVLLVTGVGGYTVEVLGVHTGFPFGQYRYGTALGTRAYGVPPIIGLAWTMLAWPAALVARRLVSSALARVVVGAWALASWDLFLDPQLVSIGGWRWLHPDPHLPGVANVPLTNYGGWLLVALVISAALQLLLRGDRGGRDGVAVGLYLWTYFGSVVALGAFLDLAPAAGWGALGMGIVALPLLRGVLR